MGSIWDFFLHLHERIMIQTGGVVYYAVGFVAVVGLLAQWRLYEKAKQPGWTALIPVLNFIVFLRIVGRPAKHLWLFLIPFYGQFYMLPKVWIEVAESFGKTSFLDHVLVILLNGLYILNLGLSYETRYMGPVYGRPAPAPSRPLGPRPSLA